MLPEALPLLVVGKNEEVATADAVGLQGGEAALDEYSPDAAITVLVRHRDVMQVATTAIVATQRGADKCVASAGDKAHPRIAHQIALKRRRRIGVAQRHSLSARPQRNGGGNVGSGHRNDFDHSETLSVKMFAGSITLETQVSNRMFAMLPRGPICVIFNPTAGRGQARRLIKAIRREMGAEIHLRPTQRPGHAVELARSAAEEGYPIVAAAGGDGTVHEVANGILLANRPDVVFSVWPVGSANDYAFALDLTTWIRRWRQIALEERMVDVGRVESGGRSEFFVNCLGIGFNGAVTYEARKISWLRGMPLYGLATLKSLWRHFDQPLLRVHFDDFIREVPTLALSVNLGQREGNFPVTPGAILDDGWFDVVQAGPVTRWQALKLLPRLATGTLSSDNPSLWLGRCREVRVESPTPLRVHVDGEFFCQPEDTVRELRIQLLPKRLRVLGSPS